MRIGQVGGAGGSGGGGGGGNAFTIIQPETGTSPTADTSTSTLTITADQSITVVGDSATKKITLNGVAFTGDSGSGGSLGMVPAPIAGDATKFLAGDGTWKSAAAGSGWALTGNTGTSAITYFVGTADNTSFNVGVSSIIRMTFGQSGPISVFYPLQMRSGQGIAFFGSDNTAAISIAGQSLSAGGYTLLLPQAIGTTNQILSLSNPANGQLSFVTNFNKADCSFTIDGGGSAITTGVKGFVRVPYNCTVTGWDIVADQSGSIVIDVWYDTYANFPPTVLDSIAGSEKPTLSSAQKNQDTSLSTWTTVNLTAGSYLGFNVDSISTCTRVTVSLTVTKT